MLDDSSSSASYSSGTKSAPLPSPASRISWPSQQTLQLHNAQRHGWDRLLNSASFNNLAQAAYEAKYRNRSRGRGSVSFQRDRGIVRTYRILLEMMAEPWSLEANLYAGSLMKGVRDNDFRILDGVSDEATAGSVFPEQRYRPVVGGSQDQGYSGFAYSEQRRSTTVRRSFVVTQQETDFYRINCSTKVGIWLGK